MQAHRSTVSLLPVQVVDEAEAIDVHCNIRASVCCSKEPRIDQAQELASFAAPVQQVVEAQAIAKHCNIKPWVWISKKPCLVHAKEFTMFAYAGGK